MAYESESKKTAAPAPRETVEGLEDGIQVGKTDRQKLDNLAMKAAKQAKNRFADDATVIPGGEIFTK